MTAPDWQEAGQLNVGEDRHEQTREQTRDWPQIDTSCPLIVWLAKSSSLFGEISHG